MGYNIYSYPVTESKAWQELKSLRSEVEGEERHLRNLITEPGRIGSFSLESAGFFYDFSRQRINGSILSSLIKLARERGVRNHFKKMTDGETVNPTENQPALHTLTRAIASDSTHFSKNQIAPNIKTNLAEIKIFTEGVRNGDVKGSTGKTFRDVVVIGIGGSHLGTAFVAEALKDYADRNIRLWFLSNVDYSGFCDIRDNIDPESTLWIVISKSFTTSEVACNSWIAWHFMRDSVPEASLHFIAISSSARASESVQPVFRAVFPIPEGVGGRYSVTSSAGIIPLSILMGHGNVLKLLKGANEMDIHASETQEEKNLPLVAALLGLWNNCFLGYPAQAIIPYSNRLSLLHNHIQQLYMESCGKSVTGSGTELDIQSGVILFGDTGTNAQHSFFQLIHQGRPFPVEFIGILNPFHKQNLKGVYGTSNHQELWANMIAQAEALACGRDSHDPARRCPGNRPSSILVMESITPENIGRLLSFHEARTVYEAFLSGYNPFDQFGVETGKTIASDLRKKMTSTDENGSRIKAVSAFYLEMLSLGNKA